MIENHLTKKDGALVGFRTQQFSLKKENNFNSVPSIERDLILDFVKKCISDLEITLQQNCFPQLPEFPIKFEKS